MTTNYERLSQNSDRHLLEAIAPYLPGAGDPDWKGFTPVLTVKGGQATLPADALLFILQRLAAWTPQK